MTNKPETAGYVMNQTMLRIKDPKVSLPFYEDVLGMTKMAERYGAGEAPELIDICTATASTLWNWDDGEGNRACQ